MDSQMMSKERLINCLRRKPIDRVPITLMGMLDIF